MALESDTLDLLEYHIGKAVELAQTLRNEAYEQGFSQLPTDFRGMSNKLILIRQDVTKIMLDNLHLIERTQVL